MEWLGLRKEPLLDDIVDAVIASVTTAPTQRTIDHVQAAYNHLCNRWNDLQAEMESLATLKEKPWLPATGDLSQWHVPSSLFPPRLRRLIDSQAKTFIFREPPSGMAEFFQMNRDAKVAHVVDHLIWLSVNQQTSAIESFEFLSRHLEDPAVEKLRDRPVYFDRSRRKYWIPERVIFGDYHSQLGPYFGYVIDPPAAWMQTLIYLGARKRLEPIRDYVTLIQDIAATSVGVPLDDDDAALLQQAYQQLWIPADRSGLESAFHRLSEQACVMDQNRHLHYGNETCFNDRPDLLAHFPEGAIPCALCTTEEGRNFLIRMGVRPLSGLVQRSLHEVRGEELDAPLSERLRLLAPHFRRVIRSHEADFSSGWCDPSRLSDVRVLRADEIQVRYFIEMDNIDVQGETRIEEAWFDEDTRFLYLGPSQSQQKSFHALARETAKILNSGLRPEILTPIIKELLSAGDASEATDILDVYGIAQLDLSDASFERDYQAAPGVLSGEDSPTSREDDLVRDEPVGCSQDFPSEAQVKLPTGQPSEAASADILPTNGTSSQRDSLITGKTRIKLAGTPLMPNGPKSDEATQVVQVSGPIPPQKLPPGGSISAFRAAGTSFRVSSGPMSSGEGLGGHYDPPKPGGYDASQRPEARRTEQIRDYQIQREGSKHKQYKEYLSRHLDLVALDLKLYDPEVATEYTFPSMDRADILCADKDGLAIPIEVETFIRQNNYVGAWQAEKYRHLAALMNGAECRSSRSILVAPSIPPEVKDWCEQHGLETREVSLPSGL